MIYKYKKQIFQVMILTLIFASGFIGGISVGHDIVYNDAKDFAYQVIDTKCPEALLPIEYNDTGFDFNDSFTIYIKGDE